MTPHAWIWLTPPLTNKCRRRVCSFFVCYVCFVWSLDHLDMNTSESRSYAPLRTRDSPIRVYIASFYFCSLLPEKDPSQVLFLQRAPSIPCGTYPTPVLGLFPFWVCSRGYLSSKHWKDGFFFDSIQDKIIKWQHQTVFEMHMIFQCIFGGTFSLELLIIWTWYQPICARKDSYPRTIILSFKS